MKSSLKLNDAGLGGTVLAPFWLELRAASVLLPLARRTRFGRADPGKRGACTIHVAQERAQERDGNAVTRNARLSIDQKCPHHVLELMGVLDNFTQNGERITKLEDEDVELHAWIA